MLGEEERSEEEGSFSKSSIPKRIIVVLAGGLVNIVFGLVVYFILMCTTSTYLSTTIDSVNENYSASQNGIIRGDEILEINGKRTRLLSNINSEIEKSNGKEVTIKIKRNNEIKYITLIPTEVKDKTIGIYLGGTKEEISAEIKSIYESSPAQKVGIKQGDIIQKINGVEVQNNPYKVVELISSSEGDRIKLEILRVENNNSNTLEFDIEPTNTTTYKLGVTFKQAEKNFENNIYYAFWDTTDFSVSILDNIKQLFIGKVSTAELMGPIGISEVVSKTQGIIEFIYMLALISLSLGVTNLLPFPPLDGGKVVLLIIEAIRRKPLKENLEVGIQMAGFAILIGLSLYVTYNDILRIF